MANPSNTWNQPKKLAKTGKTRENPTKSPRQKTAFGPWGSCHFSPQTVSRWSALSSAAPGRRPRWAAPPRRRRFWWSGGERRRGVFFFFPKFWVYFFKRKVFFLVGFSLLLFSKTLVVFWFWSTAVGFSSPGQDGKRSGVRRETKTFGPSKLWKEWENRSRETHFV